MAITKSVEKKPTPKKIVTKADMPDPIEALAREFLVARLHRTIVRLGEPVRIHDILRELGDDSVTSGVARHIMETHPRRFVAVDRRWDVTQRYLDKHAPVSRTLQEVVSIFAAPMPVDEVAVELGTIYGRVHEHFDETAPRMLKDRRYFSVNAGAAYGLSSWLLDTSSQRDDDVMFYNYLTREALEPFKNAADFGWEEDPVQAAREFLVMADGEPVDNRILQWYAWKALGEDFDPVSLYEQIHAESAEFIPLADHRWILADSLEVARDYWKSLASRLSDVVEEAPVVEAIVEAPAAPLTVTESDLAEIRDYVIDREEFFTVSELLNNVLEIAPGSRTWDQDVNTLTEVLKSHPDDFIWVGTQRFRAPGTLPPYLGQIPESLTFPVLPRFETADGEILDQLLADGAFEEALVDEILDSVAQDVNDQDSPARTRWPEGVSAGADRLRLVLKTHHKEIGTFPLSQIPRGFLPASPEIVEITVVDAAGNNYSVYVDYNVQLIYGLFDLYAEITAESGAVFHLEKTADPAVFNFVYGNETDSGVFINSHRYEELTEYRNEVESGPVSTYDIVRRILDHYRKGCSFLTLLTEVNIVRRTPRRLLASVLSSYTAFHERANRWTFDPKKEPEGFDRRKTPYVIKK